MSHALAIAACVAALVAAIPDPPESRPAPKSPDAVAVLREAAATARSQPAPPALTGGTYWYTRADHRQLRVAGGDGTGERHIVRETRENWIDARGYGRTRGTERGSGDMLWDARTGPPTPPFKFPIGRSELTLRQLGELPAQPVALLAALRRLGRVENSSLLLDAAHIVASAPLRPALRGALLEAMSLLPGLKASAARGGRATVRLSGQRATAFVALDPASGRIESISETLRRSIEGTRFRAGDQTTKIDYRAAGAVRSLDAKR